MKITIFWLAGSGTSTIWKLLAEKLSYTFMSTGNMYRQFAADAWMSVYEFEKTIGKNNTNFDIQLDQSTKEYGETHNHFVFESRLAWHFISDSIKIYLKCDEKIRYRRIQEREWWDIQEIEEKNRIREQELIARYKRIYPEIWFPPQESCFDIIIDAEYLSPDEIINNIISQIS